MAVTTEWYGLGLKAFMDGTVNWATDTIKVALATSAYVPNQDTDQYFSSVTEAAGTGYTAGGFTLVSKTSSYDVTTHSVQLHAGNPSWATASVTFRYSIVYKSTGTNTTSPLLGLIDWGADQTATNGPIAITWDATGALKVTP